MIKKANINEVLRRFDVTRMPYIAKLAEEGNLKELTEEVGNLEVAQEFIDAYKKIKSKKDERAYNKLDERQTELIKEATNKISAASVGIREKGIR